MAFTFGAHVGELRDRFPRIPPNEAIAFVWQAVKDVFNDHPWSFAIKTGYVDTEALYNTGTVAVTNGSASVTLSDGTWSTSWTTAPSTRRFVGEGRAEDLGITINTTTTGTLDANWLGETDTAASYTLYRDIYALPSDCDYQKLYFVLDTAQNCILPIKDYGVFTRRKMQENAFGTTGTPEWVTFVGLTSTGIPQIQFGPQAPSSVERYTVLYFQKPTQPATVNASILPAFPEAFEDLIWRRAVWQVSVHPRYRRAEARQYEAEYYDRLFEAKSRFDGGSAMRRQLVSSAPGMSPDWLDHYFSPRVEYVD